MLVQLHSDSLLGITGFKLRGYFFKILIQDWPLCVNDHAEYFYGIRNSRRLHNSLE